MKSFIINKLGNFNFANLDMNGNKQNFMNKGLEVGYCLLAY